MAPYTPHPDREALRAARASALFLCSQFPNPFSALLAISGMHKLIRFDDAVYYHDVMRPSPSPGRHTRTSTESKGVTRKDKDIDEWESPEDTGNRNQ